MSFYSILTKQLLNYSKHHYMILPISKFLFLQHIQTQSKIAFTILNIIEQKMPIMLKV